MKRILCVLGNELHKEIEPFIMQFDSPDCEIQLFDHIYDNPVIPSDVLGCLEDISINDNNEIPCSFMCDIPELFELVYRIYHQIFENFIYVAGDATREYGMEDSGIYTALLQQDIYPAEHLYKPVYCNKECRLKKGMEIRLIEDGILPDGNTGRTYQKYYIYQNKMHILEPVVGEKEILLMDDSTVTQGNIYYYPFLEEQICQIRDWVSSGLYSEHMQDIQRIYGLVCEQKKSVGMFQYHMFLIALEELLFECDASEFHFVLHSLSFLIKMTQCTRLFNLFMQTALALDGVLEGRHYYFLSQQMKRWQLECKTLYGDGKLIADIYQKAYNSYKKELAALLSPIPKQERNKDVIVVFTIQFLSETHAPTRTALERIYTLGKLMDKKVYVINTREQYTKKGEIPLYDIIVRNIEEEYNGLDRFEWKDYSFDFYQCPCEMPDIEEMKRIISRLRELKPYMIMTIGNGSIMSDLCANMIPVMGIPVTFSTIPKKDNQFTIVGRQISKAEKESLQQGGYDLDRIVESTFTFDLKPQKTTLTRKMLHLPEDAFVLGIVGIRLDHELDMEFFEAMEQTLQYNTYLAFAGEFKDYELWCSRVPWLREHSTFTGYQNDILAFMEVIDLYVNPRRVGGGFSIIEAFSKGKPGVTIGYGDVAAAAGDAFCVADYDEMIETIRRYIEDEAYYEKMAENGRIRALEMTDSKNALEKILATVESRKAFF